VNADAESAAALHFKSCVSTEDSGGSDAVGDEEEEDGDRVAMHFNCPIMFAYDE
jgi:hypothetical protein